MKLIPDNIPPNEELIENLKIMLSEAEKGILRSFVGVGTYNNKDVTHTCVLDKKNDIYALLGNMFILMLSLEKSKQLSDNNLYEE